MQQKNKHFNKATLHFTILLAGQYTYTQQSPKTPIPPRPAGADHLANVLVINNIYKQQKRKKKRYGGVCVGVVSFHFFLTNSTLTI